MKRLLFVAFLFCSFISAGCGPDPTPVETEISFAAMVGNVPFDCEKVYAGIGKDKGSLKPLDLRVYIHNVRLIRADNGEEVPFTLIEDKSFQASGVALLDFENGKGSCKTGTPETNVSLKGMAPKYEYKAIRFTIGVPAKLNHKDLTASPAPLNITTMSWTWKAGRIFMSAMGRNDKGIHLVHIGSAGCKGDPETGETVACDKPFRPDMQLSNFDPRKNKIVLDWGKIFSGNAIDDKIQGCNEFEGVNYCGCHSRGPSEICDPPFAGFGMTFSSGKIATENQQVFRVEPLK